MHSETFTSILVTSEMVNEDYSLMPLVPKELQPLEPVPEPERASSCGSMSSWSLEVDMASLLDSLASP